METDINVMRISGRPNRLDFVFIYEGEDCGDHHGLLFTLENYEIWKRTPSSFITTPTKCERLRRATEKGLWDYACAMAHAMTDLRVASIRSHGKYYLISTEWNVILKS